MADPELCATASKMRQRGFTLRQIGLHLKRSPQAVRMLLDPSLAPKVNALTARQQHIDRRLKEIDACRLFVNDGYSYDRISGMAECAPSTVQRWLDRHGITAEVRSRAQQCGAVKHEE